MVNVLILLTLPEPIRNQYRDRLRKRFPEIAIEPVDHHSKVGPYIDRADALITFAPMLSGDVLAAAPRLKWVQALGTGVDNLIDQPVLRKDVIVTNMRGIHGAPVSEAALAGMLALARGLRQTIGAQDERQWRRFPAQLLQDKTVGIFGVGQIAEVLAPKCKAFGMRVVGVTSAPRELAGFDRMYRREELVRVVGDFDFLVLLTPLTAATRNGIDAGIFAAMKSTSYLINLARGGIVDEPALIEARSALPAPRLTYSTRSRCRPTIRSGRCPTSSSPRIRAGSAMSTSTTPCPRSRQTWSAFSRVTTTA